MRACCFSTLWFSCYERIFLFSIQYKICNKHQQIHDDSIHNILSKLIVQLFLLEQATPINFPATATAFYWKIHVTTALIKFRYHRRQYLMDIWYRRLSWQRHVGLPVGYLKLTTHSLSCYLAWLQIPSPFPF